MYTLTPEHHNAITKAVAWYKTKVQIFKIFGPAGSGKTTLAKMIVEQLGCTCAYAALSGKAAYRLRTSGCPGANTIHYFIYRLISEEGQPPRFILNTNSMLRHVDLLIIDEVSMLNQDTFRDLCSIAKKIIVLGDPFQLPPPRGLPAVTQNPDVLLTEIHRQALESPVLRLATYIRLNKRYPADMQFISEREAEGRTDDYDMTLVGTNNVRQKLNSLYRSEKDYPHDALVAGEKLICIRNDRKFGIFNGSMWKANYVRGKSLIVEDLDNSEAPPINMTFDDRVLFEKGTPDSYEYFGVRPAFFHFGYHITTHKAQGSEWDNILIYDESGKFREDRWRWLYTAITRASKSCTVVRL